MPRPIWTGAISFGLLNIPVQLMPAERRVDLQFHLLDSRDRKRVRYERVNSETGEEVPWKEIVKAYEFSKGNYVLLEPEDIARAAPESKESVDIEAFVDPEQISLRYFDRPYYLVPARKAEKGYVLLRETLREQRKAGLARVVIRTREYLALVRPEGPALLLLLLRYPQELVDMDEYGFPQGSLRSYKLAPRELQMAKELVTSMSAPWTPDGYRNEFRERLLSVMKARARKGKTATAEPEDTEPPAETVGNVVDFMALLKKSIAEKRRSPAKKAAPATSSKSRSSKSRSRGRSTGKRSGSGGPRRHSASRS
ncbi:Ku protein [Sinimarinibacterium flocculans]|uniref:non-homologous end joining protein Ku n=1 Tax=Sinimarinibacterium flocculans TaxID=985250 RepID=UPI0024915C64|nr:Ku protein [Sinimarinibacterium flocculans]